MHKYRLSYFIGQGFKGLFHNGAMSLASIFILMFCLNIIGAFGLLIENINYNIDKIGNLNEIAAFVEPVREYEDGDEVLLAGSIACTEPSSSFLGWSVDPDSTSPEFSASSSYTVRAADAVNGTVTFYAVWSDTRLNENGFPVVFNASGTSIEGELPSDPAFYQPGDSVKLPDGPSARYSDISFLGWAFSPDSEELMQPGDLMEISEERIRGGKITLYAVWSEKTTYSAYRIAYDMNGRSVEILPTDEKTRLNEIERQIRALNNVSEVKLVSKEQALEEEIPNLSEFPALVEQLKNGDNPYPDTFYITYEDNSLVDNLQFQLGYINDIYRIECRSEYARNIESIKSGIVLVFVWFLAIIFLFSMLIIINTVKLSVYARKEEIGLMSLVGATDWFISLPFLFEGLFIGLLSGGLAFLFEKFLYSRVQVMLTTDFNMITVIPFDKYETFILIGFLAIGVFTGVVGSLISVNRYTKN